jgi:salicylate hydroxylase
LNQTSNFVDSGSCKPNYLYIGAKYRQRFIVSKPKILIAGAGLGGLSAACALMQAGYQVEVFEQAPKLGEIGAGIQLSANAMHVLNFLGVGDKITKMSVQPEAYVFRLYETGEELQRFSLAAEHKAMHRAPYNQAHRADFHNILVDRTLELGGNDIITLNKTVRGFEEDERSIRIQFTDGTLAEGDILIGADGVKSVIRDQICGEVPAVYTGDAVWRITVQTKLLPPNFQDPVMAVWMGPGKHAVSYYIRGGELLNFVGCVETDEVSEESWTAKFPWSSLKADFVGWHPDIQTIIDLADKDQCFRWSLFKRPVVDNWSTSRATIMGDAAHATLPYLAQGAAMAVEDGVVLTRALEQEGNIAKALDLYARNRVERTRRVVNGSDANRELFHLSDIEEMRRRFENRNEGSYRNEWLYSYNPLTVELI